jgi:hypothetical protein
MKRSDVVFVREDDPRCTELETEGYEVDGYSWGANRTLGYILEPTRRTFQ